ncbi:SpaH/EbpB family LPXTG-anchored major pilin, partial [Pseudoflavonifractor sp. An85]|uniref:SpaH/EbpB family LPXTG-anchored major pilin n=1 Tax=Pseudoflavonifractor sp. An85 TaxID=1965661 RepID=UPI000B571115
DKEADDTNVSIGDTVTYTVTTRIPTYPSNATYKAFNVGDTMGTGLTWDGAEKLTVYWSDDGVVDEAVKGQVVTNSADHYSVKTGSETKKEGATFEVQFNYDNLIRDYSTAKYIHVVYTATINEDAFQEETESGITNTAYTGVHNDPYDNGSYDDDTQKIEEVFTYGITVNKVAENGTTPLTGAEFKLYSNATCQTEVKFNGSNGVYKYDAGQDAPSVALATDGSGQLKLQGLAYGTYYLKETKAPNGYALPGDVVTITITDSDKDGNLDVTTATGSMVVQEVGTYAIGEPGDDPLDNIFSFKVKNEKPDFTLPTTGGMGTVAFTIGGVILMACGAALVLFAVKKFKAEG